MTTARQTSSWSPPSLYSKRLCLMALDGSERNRKPEALTGFTAPAGLPSNWTLILSETEEAIGTIGFIRRESESRLAEVGFLLSHLYRRQGFMMEACLAVFHFGFHQMSLEVIEARVRPENTASCALLKKLGMKKEGQIATRISSKGPEIDLQILKLRLQDVSQDLSGLLFRPEA